MHADFQDTFEDANDAAEVEVAKVISVERTRSLTKRRSSSLKSNAEETAEIPPVPAVPDTEVDGDSSNDESETKTTKSPLLTSHRRSTSSLDNENLDNVNLDDDTTPVKPAPPQSRHFHSIF
jgi:hypothetical protein